MNYAKLSELQKNSLLSFEQFLSVHKLKNAPTSNIKLQKVLNQLDLECSITMRDDPFSDDCGIINLHPINGTHWVCFFNNFYFDSYACPPPQNILNYIKSKFGKCIYSTYQIQKHDSLCGAYCLYILYLSNTIGFKKAVLDLYYQVLNTSK